MPSPLLQLNKDIIRIGVSGSGFIAKGFTRLLHDHPRYKVEKVLSRRQKQTFSSNDFHQLVTNNISELIDHCDIIFECSGDAIFATEVIDEAFKAKKPVLTMNAEFQITAGSYYQTLGLLHEARGDQPGSLAALSSEIKKMNFDPIVYGSQKTHLNLNPDEESTHYWAKKNQQSIESTLSFYDGTKVQIETALIANGLNTDILQEGLLCPNNNTNTEGALALAEHASRNNKIISDFVLNPNGSGEIFIVAEHHGEFSDDLAYFKMGQGPYYMIEKKYHLGYFESIQSLDELTSNIILPFNNGSHPDISVAAIAKKDLSKGSLIKNSIGSFEFRGVALRSSEHPDHVPIGLLKNFELQRNIEAGEMITFKDINLPETLAYKAWKHTQKSNS